MQEKFTSQGRTYDIEFFETETSCMIRLYDNKNEKYHNSLNNLVIVEPSYGFLLVQYIGEDVAVSGVLNEKYFSKEMTGDIICFLEGNFPRCKNVCFPYHIDFVSVSDYEEYNGEY